MYCVTISTMVMGEVWRLHKTIPEVNIARLFYKCFNVVATKRGKPMAQIEEVVAEETETLYAITHECSSCCRRFTKGRYSKAQLKKREQRRCASCVERNYSTAIADIFRYTSSLA